MEESKDWDGYKAYATAGLSIAKDAVSAELTRSLTLFESLKRLELVGRRNPDAISILLLGADYVEARYPAAQFFPLARLLGNCNVSTLNLLFVGPNLDGSIDKSEREVVFEDGEGVAPLAARLPRTRVWFKQGLYHAREVCVDAMREVDVDVVVCFHPGFWGYDSWQETIKAIPRNVPCVVTSYNREEAEDDKDVVEEALKGSGEWRWRWRLEENRFASRVERDSGIEGRPCVENKFWQAFVVKREPWDVSEDTGAS